MWKPGFSSQEALSPALQRTLPKVLPSSLQHNWGTEGEGMRKEKRQAHPSLARWSSVLTWCVKGLTASLTNWRKVKLSGTERFPKFMLLFWLLSLLEKRRAQKKGLLKRDEEGYANLQREIKRKIVFMLSVVWSHVKCDSSRLILLL